MADTILVDDNWNMGMKSDVPLDQIPKGACRFIRDLLPFTGVPLFQRRGWGTGSPDISGISGPAFTTIATQALAWGSFPGDEHLVVIARGSGSTEAAAYKLNIYNGVSGMTYVGTFTAGNWAHPIHQPVFHKNIVIIPTLSANDKLVHKYTSAPAIAALGGTPPNAAVAESYGEYLLLANGYFSGTRYANRLWASGVGTPEAGWNNTTALKDFDEEVIAVKYVNRFLLVFGKSRTYLVTGTTPPPGSDWTVTPMISEGTADPRSVWRYGDYCLWANRNGIFKTDGAVHINLTDRSENQTYWRSLFTDQVVNYEFIGGIWDDFYVLKVKIAGGADKDTFLIHIPTNAWFTLSNMPVNAFCSNYGFQNDRIGSELFMARNDTDRVGRLSSIFGPTSVGGEQVGKDANSVVIEPFLYTRAYRLSNVALKRIRRVYITNQGYIFDEPTHNPKMEVLYTTDRDLQGLFDAWKLAGTKIATHYDGSTDIEPVREAFAIRDRAQAIAFKLQVIGDQGDGMDNFQLHSIELEGHELEKSR